MDEEDEVDKMVDLVSIGNEYIQDCKDESRTRNYGIKFTKHDFASK